MLLTLARRQLGSSFRDPANVLSRHTTELQPRAFPRCIFIQLQPIEHQHRRRKVNPAYAQLQGLCWEEHGRNGGLVWGWGGGGFFLGAQSSATAQCIIFVPSFAIQSSVLHGFGSGVAPPAHEILNFLSLTHFFLLFLLLLLPLLGQLVSHNVECHEHAPERDAGNHGPHDKKGRNVSQHCRDPSPRQGQQETRERLPGRGES